MLKKFSKFRNRIVGKRTKDNGDGDECEATRVECHKDNGNSINRNNTEKNDIENYKHPIPLLLRSFRKYNRKKSLKSQSRLSIDENALRNESDSIRKCDNKELNFRDHLSSSNTTFGDIRSSKSLDDSIEIVSQLPNGNECVPEDENINTYESPLMNQFDDPNDEVFSNYINVIAQRQESLAQELSKLSKYGWYWGPVTRAEAEEKLANEPDGTFLVRDSCDPHYLLSVSFRSWGTTLHTRIEYTNCLFSFYIQFQQYEGYQSVVELIEESVIQSQNGAFCYSRGRSPVSPSYPVQLNRPLSRFTKVRSLQYLSRFVIRQYVRYDHIQQLPLPSQLKEYLEEGLY